MILSALYTVIVAFLCLVIALPAFILSWLGLQKPMSWAVYRVAQFWACCIIATTGCKLNVEGREHIPRKGGVCFVSNHNAIFDIVLALAYIGRPFGFIAKKELLFVPLFNIWIYILGGLFIDRKNARNAIKTISRGSSKIQNGSAMLIFPEGSRSKGRGLMPFRPGAMRLATNSLATIIPVAISRSYDVFERDYRIHQIDLRLAFCPPIHTAQMSAEDRKHNLSDMVRSAIEAELDEQTKNPS